jgi:hypothetical protein
MGRRGGGRTVGRQDGKDGKDGKDRRARCGASTWLSPQQDGMPPRLAVLPPCRLTFGRAHGVASRFRAHGHVQVEGRADAPPGSIGSDRVTGVLRSAAVRKVSNGEAVVVVTRASRVILLHCPGPPE